MITRRFFLSFLLVAIAASGCNAPATDSNQSAQVLPLPTPEPTPTPTPDPLAKFRAVQEVPSWAQNRVLNEVPVKPGQKLFALTFDDGPWPEHTEQILEILDEHNVKATFYMVGQMVREYPKIAKKVRDGGHSIGSHSWSHPSRPRDPKAEIEKTTSEITKVLGLPPSTFRPPYGLLKNGLAREAMKAKMPVIIWSADSDDWRRPPASRLARNVLNQATPGGIALMHDGGGPRARTVQALPVIIRELKARGYRLVTVPEILKARYIAPPKPKTKARPKPAATVKQAAKL